MTEVDVVGYIVAGAVGVIGFFLKRTMTRLDTTEKDVQTIKENYVKENDHKESLQKIDEDIKEVKKDIRIINDKFLTKEMNKDNIKQKLYAQNFKSNNGLVLRTINILRYQYHKLSDIEKVLEDEGIERWEFIDAVNYLSLSGYIKMKIIGEQTIIEEISQYHDYTDLEAKLSAKGIKLLSGSIVDEDVEV